MASYSPYNGACRALLNGTLTPGAFEVRLYTSFTFDPSQTSIATIVATEVADGNGYVSGGTVVPNISYDITNTNGCTIRGDSVLWNASGGNLEAGHALVYSGTIPIGYIDFEGNKVAPDGTGFVISWPPEGIFEFGPVISAI
jgi:hypothetical protein